MDIETSPIISAVDAEPCSDYADYISPIDLELRPTELICLLGDHAAVNTDYMRLLAGVDEPCAGEVVLFGHESSQLDEQQRRELRLQIGFIAKGGPLLSVLSGIENLKLPARYHHKGSDADIEQRAQRLLTALEYKADHQVIPAYMTALQRRHLAIARALMLEPEALFIDNPFIGLDYFSRQMIAEYLLSLSKQSGLCVVTSQAGIKFTREHADRIVFIGKHEKLIFNDWASFNTSQHVDVIEYLKQETEASQGI